MITLKSAYLPYKPTDGARYLAETLWPEGVDTQSLCPYQWVHELAPSYELQERAVWKHWEPERFRDEYRRELQTPERRAHFNSLLTEAREKNVTLLHRSRKKESRLQREDTSVFYLKEFLEEELGKSEGSTASKTVSLPETVPAAAAKQAAEQWTNEGGK